MFSIRKIFYTTRNIQFVLLSRFSSDCFHFNNLICIVTDSRCCIICKSYNLEIHLIALNRHLSRWFTRFTWFTFMYRCTQSIIVVILSRSINVIYPTCYLDDEYTVSVRQHWDKILWSTSTILIRLTVSELYDKYAVSVGEKAHGSNITFFS